MDKFDYVTMTIEEEFERLDKIIKYLKENDPNSLPDYVERYSDISKYLDAKDRYFDTKNNIRNIKNKLDNLYKEKKESETDNLLLEETLLDKFNEDTNDTYKNLLYEDIKNQNNRVKNILYLVFDKQSTYNDIIKKRNKLKPLLNDVDYPKTLETLESQSILIDKEKSNLDEIFVLENRIKIEKDNLTTIEDEVITPSILKILYEFWIVDSYDINKVNRNNLFKFNKTLVEYKSVLEDNKVEIKKNNNEEPPIEGLKLPGIDDNIIVDLNNKDYVGKN